MHIKDIKVKGQSSPFQLEHELNLQCLFHEVLSHECCKKGITTFLVMINCRKGFGKGICPQEQSKEGM